ncbi:hypothetical protein [Candidatus Erwinia haradaeae]|uniref:hypothetical protein n=1 Tax=Candidatus Erwinia haradaeae TaxID=1922217 RepID=UPI001E4E1B4A|nr:hypothetical protein [Candidatus Erwinia haradaeae]
MLLITADQIWHIVRPLIDFGFCELAEVSDLTNGVLLVNFLYSFFLKSAIGHGAEDLYAVILKTYKMGDYELQLVAVQQGILEPMINFTVVKVLFL